MLLVMKTLKDEWYIVIKASKITINFFTRCLCIIYCVSVLSLHIESTDSMIWVFRVFSLGELALLHTSCMASNIVRLQADVMHVEV